MAGRPTNPKITTSGDGHTYGHDAADRISLYGATPNTQRASAVQGSTVATVASSSDFAAAQQGALNSTILIVNEVVATLTALGAWKGSA